MPSATDDLSVSPITLAEPTPAEPPGLALSALSPAATSPPVPGTSSAPEATLPEPAPIILQASLEHILISPGHDYYRKRGDTSPLHGILSVHQVRCLPGLGLEGDRYAAAKLGHTGQVTFLAAETLDAIRHHFQLPEVDPAPFRRNLILRGANLRELLGRKFVFQNITFEGAQECKPCIWMDRTIAPGAHPFMKQNFHGGLRARILTPGLLQVDTSTAT